MLDTIAVKRPADGEWSEDEDTKKRFKTSQTSSPPHLTSSSDSFSENGGNGIDSSPREVESGSSTDESSGDFDEESTELSEAEESGEESESSSAEPTGTSGAPLTRKRRTPTKPTKRPLRSRNVPNIYKSSNLGVLLGGKLKYISGRNSKGDSIVVDNSVVPKLKPKYKAMGIYKEPTGIKQSHFKSPDEILTSDYGFEPNELVYLGREEFKNNTSVELPGEEITNAIHYYVAQRIRSTLNISDEEYDSNFTKFLDGTALLALAALVTNWVEDNCGKSTYKGYMQRVKRDKDAKLSSLDEFIRVYDESSENSDSDTDDRSNSDAENGSPFQDQNIEPFDGSTSSDDDYEAIERVRILR